MAFQWQTFKTRALTAIVFVIVMAAGLFTGKWSFFILFSFVHFGCWLEYQKLVSRFNPDYGNITAFHKYGIMIAGWCLLLYFTNYELQLNGWYFTEMGLVLGAILIIVLPVVALIKEKMAFVKNMSFSLMGIIYISLSLGLMIYMRNHWNEENYRLNMTIPLLIIFSLWINDTMAYIVGSFIGKTPLSPISPKKTWEGTIGGAILAVIVMVLIAHFTGRLSLLHTAIIAGIAAITGTMGDLFESKLKRMAGVKDSGNIMPGHGGFLDRFDSLLFAATAVWFYAVIFLD